MPALLVFSAIIGLILLAYYSLDALTTWLSSWRVGRQLDERLYYDYARFMQRRLQQPYKSRLRLPRR